MKMILVWISVDCSEWWCSTQFTLSYQKKWISLIIAKGIRLCWVRRFVHFFFANYFAKGGFILTNNYARICSAKPKTSAFRLFTSMHNFKKTECRRSNVYHSVRISRRIIWEVIRLFPQEIHLIISSYGNFQRTLRRYFWPCYDRSSVTTQ